LSEAYEDPLASSPTQLLNKSNKPFELLSFKVLAVVVLDVYQLVRGLGKRTDDVQQFFPRE
jgi:hypothetical protein